MLLNFKVLKIYCEYIPYTDNQDSTVYLYLFFKKHFYLNKLKDPPQYPRIKCINCYKFWPNWKLNVIIIFKKYLKKNISFSIELTNYITYR